MLFKTILEILLLKRKNKDLEMNKVIYNNQLMVARCS